MKLRDMRSIVFLSGVTAALLVFLLENPDRAQSQTPARPAAQTPPPAPTLPTGAAQVGQAKPQKGSSDPSSDLEQRLQVLKRNLEGTEKKLEEFSKLVAQERSRLPSESVLLDQYLFLQSQVQELGTKVEQLQGQPRAAPPKDTTDDAAPQPEEQSPFPLLSALVLPIIIVLLYDQFFNARKFFPLDERIAHLEDYAYGKEEEAALLKKTEQ